jgi:HEAT repeat protein
MGTVRGLTFLPHDATEPLAPADAQRLTEFARACKAGARAVTLYPASHPAIVTTLERIAQLTSVESLTSPLKITVLADELRVDGRAPSRPDRAIGELAALLHDHLIGELAINPGGDVEAWRIFLLLLGRPPDDIRAEGGIARLWSMTTGGHVEVKEIDYADVLRERGGAPARWDAILANLLQREGDGQAFDEEATKMLLEIAKDEQQLGELFVALESRGAKDQSSQGKAGAVVRMLQSIVKTVKKARPEEIDEVLQNLSAAVGRFSPELMVSILAHAESATSDAASVIGAVVSRMTEQTIAGFVARSAAAADSSINRVAQAFHTLVREDERRHRLIALARDQAAASPFGSTDGFEDVWNRVAERLLTSYSDKEYVSNTYARELASTRTLAVTIDQMSDDPPERVSGWLGTVATSELRKLDLALLLDLLVIEEDDGRWGTLMQPVAALLEDLMLVGDFEAAAPLLSLITDASTPGHSKERRQHSLIAIDLLVSGSMLRHIVAHIGSMNDAQFDRVKAMCLSLGEELVRPIAEAITTDVSDTARDRLSLILVAFGQAGRRQVERLKNSDNREVRRTAIMLLRELGGGGALPELTQMLRDRSPQIQREAVRAILNIGSQRALEVLQNAITHGSAEARDTIMKSLASVRDDHAAQMFGHIISHVDHRGELRPVYLGAIDALGALKAADGVRALREALYRGEWWAPRRTASLRSAAAASLARIGTPEAIEVLEQALSAGPRGVRSAVRPHVSTARAHQKTR